MIIAGPCLIIDREDSRRAIDTARALSNIGDFYFRVKLIGGGTTPEKFNMGVGLENGLPILENINNWMPAGTEVHTPEQTNRCWNLSFLWLGARNCSNYSMYRHLSLFPGMVMIKRGPATTISELIGISDIFGGVYNKKVYIVERGIVGIDRTDRMRWHIDLNSIVYLKHNRPDIFNNLIVDCSHSAGVKENVADIYFAMKAIGVQHFMFECTIDGLSKTDQSHMISVDELKKILGE